MNIPRYLDWCRESSRRVLLIPAAYLLFAAAPPPTVGSGTILSTGFDTFANGALQSQSGWLTAGGGVSTAMVQSSTFQSAGKAVTVTRAAAVNGDQRWAKPVTGYPTQRFVTVDWDMRVSQPTPLTAYGPFFGVDTYDADEAPYVLGSLGVDASTGDVMYQVQDSGYLDLTGTVVGFDVWNHFRIVLDFATDTYQGFVNDSLVATTGFVDRGYNLNNFTDADIATFASNPDPQSQAMSASAVFDNFVIRDGLIGDYDVEGNVDEADYARWRETFGSTVAIPGNLADGSSSGFIDAADYVAWRKYNGQSLFPGMGSGGSPVPEPSNMVSLVAAAALMFQAARRTRLGKNNRCNADCSAR